MRKITFYQLVDHKEITQYHHIPVHQWKMWCFLLTELNVNT